jgi:hypothetical protein
MTKISKTAVKYQVNGSSVMPVKGLKKGNGSV